MTQTQIEILITIIDKGLLALVIVLIGYFYNRKLEKKKVNYNKRLIYEKEKISTLIKLATRTHFFGNSTNELLYEVNEVKNMDINQKEVVFEKLSKALLKYNNEREKFIEAYNSSYLFIEIDLIKHIIEYLDLTNEASEAITSQEKMAYAIHNKDNSIRKRIDSISLKTKEIAIEIQNMINKELE